MENGLFLITGTSRGIVEALAQKILEKGKYGSWYFKKSI